VTEPVDGGVARCVVEYVRDQVRRGWTVSVVSPPDPRFVGELQAVGASHVALPVPARLADDRPGRPRPSELLRGGRAIARFVAGERPDVVHLHSSWAGLAGRLTLRGGPPTLFQPHGWSFDAVAPRLRPPARLWERFAARWTTGIVCVSEGERRRGADAGISARWHVVQNGIDVAASKPAGSAERDAARTALGVSQQDRIALCVGRLSAVKGQDVLLDAWATVVRAVPRALLLLAGDGPDRAELEARALERVRFLGRPADLPAVYAAADLVVIPSRSEGMSITMLEAMARGRSVVSTEVGGAREAIGTEAGAVVPMQDPSALADALAARLADVALAEREGSAARRRVEESFDIRRATDALADVYRSRVD
jgi:glycosyltransferase involved in cell wall biosynthesis